MKHKEKVKLLWTSGWDSTFRLLQLIDEKKVDVEPYYIVDTNRSSTLTEIKTLTTLKELIKKFDLEAYERIGEFNFYSIHEIKEDDAIRNAYLSLKSKSHLGGQYEWLARLTAQQKYKH